MKHRPSPAQFFVRLCVCAAWVDACMWTSIHKQDRIEAWLYGDFIAYCFRLSPRAFIRDQASTWCGSRLSKPGFVWASCIYLRAVLTAYVHLGDSAQEAGTFDYSKQAHSLCSVDNTMQSITGVVESKHRSTLVIHVNSNHNIIILRSCENLVYRKVGSIYY